MSELIMMLALFVVLLGLVGAILTIFALFPIIIFGGMFLIVIGGIVAAGAKLYKDQKW